MTHYRHDVLIAAPASAIYDALTTPRGIHGWWTVTADVGTAVGERITVRFGQTFKVMRVEVLRPGNEVRWSVVDSHLHVPGVLTRTNEWIGTTIVFRLSQHSASTTRLELEHIGLIPEVECYDICSQGWVQFLGSLKQYVETGTGSPFAG